MNRIILIALVSLALPLRAGDAPALQLTATIPLPGVQGRFDHFAIDTKGQRLFVAALGNNSLEAVDLAAGRHLHSITGLHKPTGVLFLPDRNRLFVANGDDGTLKVFDGTSLRLLSTLPGLDDADNVRFDARTGSIYLGYGDGALAVMGQAAEKIEASIKLAGHPESFQLERTGTRVFVNVPDARQVAVVDREKQAVVAAWPMETFTANFPMALDEPNRRLFVGCRRPARLVVLDTATGRPAATLVLSGDIDDLFYDAAQRRLYASCGEGFIDVFAQRDADHYERRERIPTRAGARTAYFSAERAEFYLAVPHRGGQDAELRIYQVR